VYLVSQRVFRVTLGRTARGKFPRQCLVVAPTMEAAVQRARAKWGSGVDSVEDLGEAEVVE
jgi:hypothetical protein